MYGPSLLSTDDSLRDDGAAGEGGRDAGTDGPPAGGSGAGTNPIDSGDSGGAGVGGAGNSSSTGSLSGTGDYSSIGGFADSGGASASSGGANASSGGAGALASGGGGRGGASEQGGASARGGAPQGGSAQGGSAQGGATTQGGSTQGGTSGQASGGSSSVAPHDLGQGKPATASTQQTGNEISKGNDGNYATRWCASDDTVPQWWRVDLGAPHPLTSFSVAFQLASRTYGYTVETSLDDVNYDNSNKLVVTGTGAVQSQNFPSGATGRYVRIRITSAPPVGTSPTWASFYEFSVQGI